MDTPPPRIVSLVLVDAQGRGLGALPPFEVDTPWWQDMAPVVRTARSRDGLRVSVLRLIAHERPAPHGGAVSYLAQWEAGDLPGSLRPWQGDLDAVLSDAPHRRPYARVGGPAADLAWAASVLAAHGGVRVGQAEQDRTWNLSSLWRLDSTLGRVWLKAVPPFFAHEGRLLAALADGPVPRLLGHDEGPQGGRILMPQLGGRDLYDADAATCLDMIDLLVDLQARVAARVEEFLALGLPDWRAPALTDALAALVERCGSELAPDARRVLAGFVEGLPRRFIAIAACGLPDTLVHGDFHPGNLRGGEGAPLVLLDWGDGGIGHPLLDQPAFLDRIVPAAVDEARGHWSRAWRRAVPGADAAEATRLLTPVAMARQALIYQRFLDGIEASEQAYHRNDVTAWLRRCAVHLQHVAARLPGPARDDLLPVPQQGAGVMASPIRMISSMATRQVLAELVAQYQAETGREVAVESVGGVDAARRVRAGEAFDAVVLASNVIDELAAAGQVLAGSRVDLVRSGVSIAVKAGAPRPDIGSEAAVKQAVQQARSVSYSTGPSGAHLARLFERWGIAEVIKDRIVTPPPGVPVGSLVAQGQVELGFQQLSELIHLGGIEVLGPLPPEIQSVTVFAGGVVATSTQADAVRALLAFLAAPGAAGPKLANGMEPA